MLCVSLAIAGGCGDTTDRSRDGQMKRSTAHVVPEDAFLVVRIDATGGGLRKTRDVLRRVPIWGIVDDEVRTRDDVAALVAREINDRSRAQIKVDELAGADEWIGSHAGFALVADGARTSDGIDAIGWIETRAARQAWRAIRDAAQLDEQAIVEDVSVAHARGVWGAEIDGTIVIASSRSALQRSITAHKDGALEMSSSWDAVMRKQSGERTVGVAWLRARYTPEILRSDVPYRGRIQRWAGDARAVHDGSVIARFGTHGAGVWAQLERDINRHPSATDASRIASGLNQIADPIKRRYPALIDGSFVSICATRSELRQWPIHRAPGRAEAKTRGCTVSAHDERWSIHIDLAALAQQIGKAIDPRAEALLEGQFSHIGVPQIIERVEQHDGSYRVITRMDARLVE